MQTNNLQKALSYQPDGSQTYPAWVVEVLKDRLVEMDTMAVAREIATRDDAYPGRLNINALNRDVRTMQPFAIRTTACLEAKWKYVDGGMGDLVERCTVCEAYRYTVCKVDATLPVIAAKVICAE